MSNKSESEIILSYSGALLSGQTIRGIAQSLKKPYPHVHRHVHSLLDKQVMLKREIGPSYLCFLNFKSEAGKIYAANASLDTARRKLQNNKKLRSVAEAISKSGAELALVVVDEPLILHDSDSASIAKRLAKNFSIDAADFSSFFSTLTNESRKQLVILHGHYVFFDKLGKAVKNPASTDQEVVV